MYTLLDHLEDLEGVQEYPSYVQAKCPNCKGLLKISKSSSYYGAYRCWTNYCSPKDIRKCLPSNGDSVFSQRSSIDRSTIFDLPNNILTVSPSIPKEYTYTRLKVIYKITTKEGNKTTFIYAKGQRVTRYDNSNKQNFKKSKAIIPEYYDHEDSTWKYGKNNEEWPCYGLDEVLANVQIQSEISNSALAIFAVEGEKTCNFVRRLGLCCITFQTSQYNPGSIQRQLLPLVNSVGLIIYIEDNDAPGIKKGKSFKQGADLAGIPSISIPYTDLIENAKPEDDLVDSKFTLRSELLSAVDRYVISQ